jgi:WD40 repeat protein
MTTRHVAPLAILLLAAPAAAQPRGDALGDPLPPGAIARLGTLRFKQDVGDDVYAVAYSPDGKRVASRGLAGPVYVWEADTGKELRRLKVAAGADPHALAFGPGGVLAAGAGKDVLLWDAATGKLLHTLTGHQGAVLALVFADDGKTLLSIGADAAVRWWDVAAAKSKREWRLPDLARGEDQAFDKAENATFAARAGAVTVGTFTPRKDAEKPLSVLVTFDLAAAKELSRWPMHYRRPDFAALSPDGTLVAEAHPEFGLSVYPTGTGKEKSSVPLRSVKKPQDTLPHGLTFSPDGNFVAAVGFDWHVALWDLNTRTLTVKFPRAEEDSVESRCVAFAPDGKSLLAGAGNELVRYDVPGLRDRRPTSGHRRSVDKVRFTPSGSRLVTASPDSWGLRAEALNWNTTTWKLAGSVVPGPLGLVLTGEVPAGHGVALASGEDGWAFIDLPTGKTLGRLEHASQINDNIVYSRISEGRRLYLLPRDGGSPLDVWLIEVPWGKALGPWKLPDMVAWTWNADDTLVAYMAGDDGRIGIFDVTTGKERLLGQADAGFSSVRRATLAFSPNNRWLASWHDNDHKVRTRDLATGKQRQEWQLKASPREGGAPVCLAWSPDGRTVAVGEVGGEHVIQLWEAETGKLRREFRGHRGPVRSLAFSPDGRLLASGSQDTTVLVWDVLSGEN